MVQHIAKIALILILSSFSALPAMAECKTVGNSITCRVESVPIIVGISEPTAIIVGEDDLPEGIIGQAEDTGVTITSEEDDGCIIHNGQKLCPVD